MATDIQVLSFQLPPARNATLESTSFDSLFDLFPSFQYALGLSQQVGRCRIDGKPGMQGGPTQQHAEFHRVPVGEGKLDGPAIGPDSYRRFNYQPLLPMATGIRYHAFIKHIRDTDTFDVVATLKRVQAKTYAHASPALEGFDKKRMQRGRACSGIHFTLDPVYPQVRKFSPLAPTQYLPIPLVPHATQFCTGHEKREIYWV